jgi:transcriptional antiterminator RfaH
MSYWACAQLEANRERLAVHCLSLGGFEVYLPRLRVKRATPARKTSMQAPALFPGYGFVLIELQWHAARWSPGVLRFVLDGDRPARVPDKVIAELKERERNGPVPIGIPSRR